MRHILVSLVKLFILYVVVGVVAEVVMEDLIAYRLSALVQASPDYK